MIAVVHPFGNITTHIMQTAMVGREAPYGSRHDKLVGVPVEDPSRHQRRGVVSDVGHHSAGREVIAPGKPSQRVALDSSGERPLRFAGKPVADAARVEADDDALILSIERG